MLGVASRPDKIFIPEPVKTAGASFAETSARTQKSPSLLSGALVKTGITWGQSNAATVCGNATYTPSNPSSMFNLNIHDGALYDVADPIFGCQAITPPVTSVHGPFADRFISKYPTWKMVLVPTAIGGTTYAQWTPDAPSANIRTSFFWRLHTAIYRCRALGLEPDFFWCRLGESDKVAATAQASITSSIQQIVDAIRAQGCTAPCWFDYSTMEAGALGANVRSGVAAAVEVPRNIKLCYDADNLATVAGGYRLGDQTHLSNTGCVLVGQGASDLILP